MNRNIENQINKINSIELILNGTLSSYYKKCGKISCKCYEDKKFRHGPYLIWTRKVKGKTVTKTLTQDQAVAVKKAMKEMKKLNVIVEKWKQLSLDEINKI